MGDRSEMEMGGGWTRDTLTLSLVSPPQAKGHRGTAGHNRGNGVEEARLPRGATSAEPGTAGGAGALGLSHGDQKVANLVAVSLRVGGTPAGLRSPMSLILNPVSLDAPMLGPEPFCSNTSPFWPGCPGIPCVSGSWVTYCLA